MTMRQVLKLFTFVQRENLVEFYNSILSYRAAHNKELPSLDEFLSLSLNQPKKDSSAFSEDTDKFLEAQALKRLEERRLKHGK